MSEEPTDEKEAVAARSQGRLFWEHRPAQAKGLGEKWASNAGETEEGHCGQNVVTGGRVKGEDAKELGGGLIARGLGNNGEMWITF